jgi:uncharacterized DUF497 family protein
VIEPINTTGWLSRLAHDSYKLKISARPMSRNERKIYEKEN